MNNLSVGVDVGGTKILTVLADSSGRVHAESERKTPLDFEGPANSLGAVVASEVALLCASEDIDPVFVSVGVGVAGMVDLDGRLAFAPHLPTAVDTDVGAEVAEALANPRVVVDNDANCAAVAEVTWGAARGASDVVVLTLGTGIGGGFVLDGRIRRGRNGFAGEVGHVVVEPGGVACPCGGRGCWERYASGGALVRLTNEALVAGRLNVDSDSSREGDQARDVTRRARFGDAEAQAIVDEMGWWLGLGLANLAVALDCGSFLIGGGLSHDFDLFEGATRLSLEAHTEGVARRSPIEVTRTRFGPRAAAVGASLVARGGHE